MEDEEVCGICLEPLARSAHVGRLDGCTHRYCVACIAEWAKIANVCPQCKARFHAVREESESSSSKDGEVVLRVRDANNLCESRLQRASLRELTHGWTAVDHRELRRILESFGFAYRRGDYVLSSGGSDGAAEEEEDEEDESADLDVDDPSFVVPDHVPHAQKRRHNSHNHSPRETKRACRRVNRLVVDSDSD